MTIMRTKNEKTGEHFDVDHWCVFIRRDMIDEEMKKRKWNPEECISFRVEE